MNRWLTDYLLPWHLLRVQSCCSVQPHATLSTRSRPGRFKGKARGDKICFRFQQVFTYIYIYNVATTNTYQIAGEKTKDVYLLSRAVLQLRLWHFLKSKITQNKWAILWWLKYLPQRPQFLKKDDSMIRSDVLVLHMLKLNMWKPEILLFSYLKLVGSCFSGTKCQGEDSIHHTNSCM